MRMQKQCKSRRASETRQHSPQHRPVSLVFGGPFSYGLQEMGLKAMSGSWEGPEILKLTDSLHKGSRPYWCHVTLSPGSRNVGAPSERTEVFGLSFKIPSVLLRKCSEMNLIIGRKATHRRDMLPPASRLWSHSEVSSGDRAPYDGRVISVSESRGEAAEPGRISEVRELVIFPDPRLAFGWDLVIDKSCSPWGWLLTQQ